MIVGIGTDIVQVARIISVLERQGRAFAERVLCGSELAIFDRKKQQAAYLAKRFAAKEAASKALGTGIGKVSWQDMEITNNGNGAPLLNLSGAAARRLSDLGGSQALISLSDEKDYVVAFVVLS
ncbi:MAG: holo-ACP synthase [Pseudomonadales bacterium]|nr:holo-ACP synthase [Pseudomonadales bacterium]MCP5171805.1 holo-ACP synthase [Pseudomonadales bacterium]